MTPLRKNTTLNDILLKNFTDIDDMYLNNIDYFVVSTTKFKAQVINRLETNNINKEKIISL